MNCGEILLVDDDPVSLFITETIIASAASEVCAHQYEDASPAVDFICACEENLTVIFLDINLKDRTGWEVIDELRERVKDGTCKHIPPIVMLTSSIAQSDKKKAEQYEEVIHFISKPFKPEHCQEVMHKIGLK